MHILIATFLYLDIVNVLMSLSLLPSTYTIRDGNYGGLVTFFNEDGSEVVIVSALNEFMISNLRYRQNDDPEVRSQICSCAKLCLNSIMYAYLKG